jgi:hypothetical protein
MSDELLKKKPSDNMTKAELLAYIEAQQAENSELAAKVKAIEDIDVEADLPETEDQAPKDVQKWLNEKVPYYAFKDNDKYKDDIVVGVNGKTFIIQRGVQVMIPRYLKFALDDSAAQKAHAADVITGLQEQSSNRAKELGL